MLLGVLVLVGACAPSSAPERGGTAAGTAPAAAPAQPAAEPTPPPPIRLTVNWTAVSGSQSGIWLAYEGGYFREQGLDVELVNIASTSRAIQAMVAGEVQLGSLDPAASIQANLGGADLALLFAATNRLVFSVMSQPSIREPQALRGKTMGITRIGSSTHTAALVALEMWGLAPDRDVSLRQLQEVPAILAALQAGQVDAGVVSPPTNTQARRAGFYELINLATQGPEYPSVSVGGPRSWITANEEAVRRFARAYVLGIHRLKTDKPFALEVYRKYLKVEDPEILEDTYAQFSTYFPSVPYISEEGLARLIEDLAKEEPRLAGRQPAEFIDSRFLRELEASGFIRQVVGEGR
ncbi:MAG TPA: ABC transporter substrate-binding protein [Chloroflexota bacterium]|nr:ABC transporter substrate-binding protein [Chloroflexota bacterium]